MVHVIAETVSTVAIHSLSNPPQFRGCAGHLAPAEQGSSQTCTAGRALALQKTGPHRQDLIGYTQIPARCKKLPSACSLTSCVGGGGLLCTKWCLKNSRRTATSVGAEEAPKESLIAPVGRPCSRSWSSQQTLPASKFSCSHRGGSPRNRKIKQVSCD